MSGDSDDHLGVSAWLPSAGREPFFGVDRTPIPIEEMRPNMDDTTTEQDLARLVVLRETMAHELAHIEAVAALMRRTGLTRVKTATVDLTLEGFPFVEGQASDAESPDAREQRERAEHERILFAASGR